MERYIWENNASKSNIEKMFGRDAKDIGHIGTYSASVDKYMNEGEYDLFLAIKEKEFFRGKRIHCDTIWGGG
jgi:hypothetical protein